MKKPKLRDYIVELTVEGEKVGGINFHKYSLALEKYVEYLEKKLERHERGMR